MTNERDGIIPEEKETGEAEAFGFPVNGEAGEDAPPVSEPEGEPGGQVEGDVSGEGSVEDGPEYYSLERLENWDDEKDGEIEPELIPPAFKRIYERLGARKGPGSLQAAKSFEEQLKELSGEEESFIRPETGLSVEETLLISREASGRVKDYLAGVGEEYDEYNQEHREILSGMKSSLTEQVMRRKREQAAYKGMDEKMRRRYGAGYPRIDAEVGRYLNEDVTLSQLRRLNSAILNGNMDIAAALYDMAARKLEGGGDHPAERKPQKRPVFPPHSVNGGAPRRAESKRRTEADIM